ncbi:butyrophilin subfamily 2 member A2 L homeolog precursor [Xenopus laevis]|uniref:Butyrophilin subfamily 2 member A2 L homeolog precursor n=1 Tax=Xenopus laevis TaxID=8355 RepID=A1L2I3_XENLA|nr:butyrophilin subfamily 2 member A2 L homeolog precursor [Xenopus laevis]AAI29540.1 LOC100036856 protein [Xenopus laevis]
MTALSINLLFTVSITSSLIQASLSERFQVIPTKSPVTAILGSSVELNCHLFPEMNAEKMEIRWLRNSFRPYVHLYLNGEDNYREQMEEFRGRTEFLKQNINRGIGALTIHKVQLSDQGLYTCYFESESNHNQAQVELKVAAMGLHPFIWVEDYQNGKITLNCESSGWYPKPTAMWQDESGTRLESTEKINVTGETGLFHVTSAISIETQDKISCYVRNDLLEDGKESSIKFAESFYWRVDRSGISRFVLMASCLAVALITIGVTPQVVRMFRIRTLQNDMGKLSDKVDKVWIRAQDVWNRLENKLDRLN